MCVCVIASPRAEACRDSRSMSRQNRSMSRQRVAARRDKTEACRDRESRRAATESQNVETVLSMSLHQSMSRQPQSSHGLHRPPLSHAEFRSRLRSRRVTAHLSSRGLRVIIFFSSGVKSFPQRTSAGRGSRGSRQVLNLFRALI
jgi:hypothetical protein